MKMIELLQNLKDGGPRSLSDEENKVMERLSGLHKMSLAEQASILISEGITPENAAEFGFEDDLVTRLKEIFKNGLN